MQRDRRVMPPPHHHHHQLYDFLKSSPPELTQECRLSLQAQTLATRVCSGASQSGNFHPSKYRRPRKPSARGESEPHAGTEPEKSCEYDCCAEVANWKYGQNLRQSPAAVHLGL